MDYTNRKVEKNDLIRLILCAVFALAALLLSRISFRSGNVQTSFDAVPAVLSVLYIVIVSLGGLLGQNKKLRLICCGLSCLMAVCWLLPLGGMKTQALSRAFAQGNGHGLALLIEYLRCLFMIALHVLVVISVAGDKRKKMQQLESVLLYAALIFFVSSIILSLFASPAYDQPARFMGLRFWKHFFSGALSSFSRSSASLFPICDGAVLLLLFCVVRIYNLSSVPAEQGRRNPVMEPVPAAPHVRSAAAAQPSAPANPQRPAAASFIGRTSAAPARTSPPIAQRPAAAQPSASAFIRKTPAEVSRTAAPHPARPAAARPAPAAPVRPAAAKPAQTTASSFIIKTSAESTLKTPAAPASRASQPRKAANAETNIGQQDQLQNLANLRNKGAISDEEFYRRKRELMGK